MAAVGKATVVCPGCSEPIERWDSSSSDSVEDKVKTALAEYRADHSTTPPP